MQTSEFEYELPSELIAQEPLAERDRSRMLIIDRATRSWRDSSFAEFPTLIEPGDMIVVNNTRVFPARLLGRRIRKDIEGAAVEILLVRQVSDLPPVWEVLTRPGRAMKPGAEITFDQGRLRGEVLGLVDEGRRLVRFDAEEDFNQIVDEIGKTPLPPYIKRAQEEDHRLDKTRYQTVFASQRGAIAAPTAGLHFTPEILAELKSRDNVIIEITHHVGYATFQPVRVEMIEEHRIASETYEISTEAADAINRGKRSGRRLVAVGTTTTRALESAAEPEGTIRAEHRCTDLFIYPGYQFRAIDALLTNF